MNTLSETLTELGIAFSLPITIKDANGNETYHEDRDGDWWKFKYDANGNLTYHEHSTKYDANGNLTCCGNIGYWWKREYDASGNSTYYENSDGDKSGTPKSVKTCEGKVVEVDGIKYELRSL